MENKTQTLKTVWEKYKKENPNIRIRNAAKDLNVTEMELLATSCGEHVSRLIPDMEGILDAVKSLGKVMALTRNNAAVHERKGIYKNMKFNKHVGLFVGKDIDLRIFPSQWEHAFAVNEMSGDTPRYSLQFFSPDGEAAHKIYLTKDSNFDVYQSLVKAFRSDNQSQEVFVLETPARDIVLPDSEIDSKAFQDEWINLKDTHDFFGMLRKYKVSRTQALRLAPEGNYAVQVANNTFSELCELVAERNFEIMIFVGNKATIQIHTGPIKKLMEYGEWYNIMDPEFNLHLNETMIDTSWIVRKPTEDGVVTALEVFDTDGEIILQMFGKRKPGQVELEEWRTAVAQIEQKNKV